MRSALLLVCVAAAALGGCGRDVLVGADPASAGLPGRVPPVRPGPLPDGGGEPGGPTFQGTWSTAARGVAGLEGLFRITGDLVVDSPELQTLVLYDLAVVDGALLVEQVEALTNLNLPSLTRVGGSLVIRDAPALTAVSAPRLEEVSGSLHLQRAPALSFINLDALGQVGEAVVLDGLAVLLFTLPALGTVDGSLTVGGLAAAGGQTQEIALPALTEVGRDLEVVRAPAVRSLRMEALAEIEGRMWIAENPSLRELHLPALTAVGSGGCVCDNPLLSSCEAEAVATAASGPAVVVGGNADGSPCD